MPTNQIEVPETNYRSVTIGERAVDQEARTIEIAFSSEEPVSRFFGEEILDHDAASVRLDRLNDGGPLLVDHRTGDHIGVVERAWIDGRRGRANVRFGRSARAEEIFNDVIDGIRSHISVGYAIHRLVLAEQSDDGPDVFRVTDWEPLEVSIVPVPADPTVGVGRSREVRSVPVIIPETQQRTQETMPDDPNTNTDNRNNDPAPAPAPVPAVPAVDVNAERADAVTEERTRISEINAIAAQFNSRELREAAAAAVEDGTPANDFRARTLDILAQADRVTDASGQVIDVRQAQPGDDEIGMSAREIGNYSFMRALRAVAFGHQNPQFLEEAAFERELSDAAAGRLGTTPRGIFVPADVLRAPLMLPGGQRELNVTTPTAGGNLVAEDLLSASFIDLLRNRTLLGQIGATMLSDLVGNVAIPRQTGGATAYWLDPEGAAITPSEQTFDQVAMTPKSLGGLTEYTRQLLLQSSIDIENFVRGDLTTVLGLAIDLAGFYGSGAAGEPTGIANQTGINTTTFAGPVPTWAEVVAMESAVAVDNADLGALAYVVEAAMRGSLKTTVKDAGSGQFVWDTQSPDSPVNGYRTGVTNQVTSGDVFFGNFNDLLIGMWGSLDLLLDPYTHSDTGSTRITAMQSIDIAVRHPESFCLSNDTP